MTMKGYQKVLIFIIPCILFVGTFQYIGILISGTSMELDAQRSLLQQLYIKLFDAIGTFLLIIIFVKLIFKESICSIGFTKQGIIKQSISAITFTALGIISMYIILLKSHEVSIEYFSFSTPKVIGSIIYFFLVAFTEEILFRGYIQYYLMQSFNKYTALVISSLIFALMHAPNPNVNLIGLIQVFCSGLVMGLIYNYTKSLWFPIAEHFMWNFTQVHLGFNVSGLENYSLINITYEKDNILNGGAFGFEGSVLSFASLGIILIGFLLMYKKRNLNYVASPLK